MVRGASKMKIGILQRRDTVSVLPVKHAPSRLTLQHVHGHEVDNDGDCSDALGGERAECQSTCQQTDQLVKDANKRFGTRSNHLSCQTH